MKEYYFGITKQGREYEEWYESDFNILKFGKIIIETKGSPFRIKCVISTSYCTKEGLLLKDIKKDVHDITDKERIYKFPPFLDFNIQLQEITEIRNQKEINLTTIQYVEESYVVIEIDENISSKMFEEYVNKVENLGNKAYDYLIEKHQYIIDKLVVCILNNTSAFSVFTLNYNGLMINSNPYGGLSFKNLNMQNPNDLYMLCSIALAIYRTLTDKKLFELFLERQNSENLNYKDSEFKKISYFNCNYFLIDNSITYYLDGINFKSNNNSLSKW